MAKITKKSILSSIASFSSNRAKLQAQAHSIAMAIYLHTAPEAISPDANGTGDCSLYVELINEMPKSWGVQLLDWMKAVSPMRVNVSTGKYGYAPEYKALSAEDKLKAWNLELANTTPFYEYSKEAPVRDNNFDAEDFLKGITNQVKRAEKAIKDGNVLENQRIALEAMIKMVATLSEPLAAKIPANTNTNEKAVA